MTITYELDFRIFKAWSGAVDTQSRIIEEGKADAFEQLLEDIFPEGMSETALNDLLWFEAEQVYAWLGISEEGEEED